MPSVPPCSRLKKGDVSEPLKQPNGFYLLRAEEVTVRPLSEVRDDIYNDLKNHSLRPMASRHGSRRQGADRESGLPLRNAGARSRQTLTRRQGHFFVAASQPDAPYWD